MDFKKGALVAFVGEKIDKLEYFPKNIDLILSSKLRSAEGCCYCKEGGHKVYLCRTMSLNTRTIHIHFMAECVDYVFNVTRKTKSEVNQ